MRKEQIVFSSCSLTLAVAMALGLSGCGGGSGVRPTPQPGPSPSPSRPTSISGDHLVDFDGATRKWPQDVDGSGRLIKAGTGKLTLTGTDTYSGGTEIKAGILQIGDGGTEGSIIGDVKDNATLVFDRKDEITFDGVISGTGKLVQAGAGTLSLTGDNSYTGGTTIKHGTLQVGDGGTEGSIAGDVSDQGTLTFDRKDSVALDGVISGDGKLIQAGAGTLTLSGDNTYNGGTTIKQGTLQIGDGGTQGSLTGDVADQGTLVFDRKGDITFDGVISGTGTLVQAGAGTLSLTGDNSYTGGTTIKQGTLQVGDGGTEGSIAGDVADQGTLTFDRKDNIAFDGVISGDGKLVQAGVGTLTLTGDNPYSGGTTIKQGTLQIGDGGTQGSITGDVADQGTLVFNRKDDITFDGDVSGDGELVHAGSGTLTLTGDNTYTDGTTVKQGTLQIGDGGTDGTITGDLYDDGTVVFNHSDDKTFSGDIHGSGKVVKEGSGTLTLEGDGTYGDTVISAGTLKLHYDIGTMFEHLGYGTLTDNSRLTLDVGNGKPSSILFPEIELTYPIEGSGVVVKTNNGAAILTGKLTYSGGMTIQKGIVHATAQLPGNVAVQSGGQLGFAQGNFPSGFDDLTASGASDVGNDLSNAGDVYVYEGDTKVGGAYTQKSTGTLHVSLGSKLDVTGKATLTGTLDISGHDKGYVVDHHTVVLKADAGIDGTFDKFTDATGGVFIGDTPHYGSDEVWLDVKSLPVATTAAGQGVHYTPASLGSAVRVQRAFDNLNRKLAAGDLHGVSPAFVDNAGAFQHAPDLETAQASLKSLSGQLHAASAGVMLHTIDTTGRALAKHLTRLSQYPHNSSKSARAWAHVLGSGGGLNRGGYADVDYQLHGWLVGQDQQLSPRTWAGLAVSKGASLEQLSQRFDRNRSRNTSAMAYAAWRGPHWYAHSRIGFGHYHQNMRRTLLLGTRRTSAWTDYSGHYQVVRGESGRHATVGNLQLTPFVAVEYDRVGRNGFVEHGAGGFGLKARHNLIRRWQAGAGIKLSRKWSFDGGRSLRLDARVERRRTLADHGTVFRASLVGMSSWRPLTGVGLSRHGTVAGLDLNARTTANSRLKLGYEYLTGDRGHARMLSARFSWHF